MKITTGMMRTIDRAGGLDNFLIQSNPETLAPNLRRLRGIIAARTEAAAV